MTAYRDLGRAGFSSMLTARARSSKSNILHIDVAFPLNRAQGVDAVQLLVYTKVTL